MLPIIIRVHKARAIYLAQNGVSGPRMKHIDVCYHFILDYIESTTVKLVLSNHTTINVIFIPRTWERKYFTSTGVNISRC